MMSRFFAATTAALALASLAAIPARGAVWNVTVGGPGILRYDPQFVVRSPLPPFSDQDLD